MGLPGVLGSTVHTVEIYKHLSYCIGIVYTLIQQLLYFAKPAYGPRMVQSLQIEIMQKFMQQFCQNYLCKLVKSISKNSTVFVYEDFSSILV
jgi:hypothetical protein